MFAIIELIHSQQPKPKFFFRKDPVSKHLWRVISILTILLSAAIALLPYLVLTIPNPAAASDAPSTRRAVQTISLLSQSPRSVGTDHHIATRAFLIDELTRLGLEVDLQETAVAGQPIPLVNILGRMAGKSQNHEAVVIMAHYDSSEGSPGAMDNGSGVAIVLEIARAITEGPQPENDLIVLFTDAEEQGVLGAPEFVSRHPWAKSVRAALNFDSVSVGPVFLWQTSPQNGWLIEQYAASPRPVAVSWIDSIARLLPLDTDFRPFLEAGISGASFTTAYLPAQDHISLDQIHLVNPASVQHSIEQGLALTNSLLNSDLSAVSAPDRAYLNPWGSWFVSYSTGTAVGLGLFAGLVTLAVFLFRGLRKTTSIKETAAAAFFTTANLLFALLFQFALEIITFVSVPLLSPWVKIPLSLVLLSLFLVWGFWRVQKRVSLTALLFGAQMVWAVLTVWASLAIPPLSPPLTSILLASLLPYCLDFLHLKEPLAWAVQAISLALVLLLGAPVVYLLYMITGLIWIPAMLGAFVWVMLLALIFPNLTRTPYASRPVR